MAQFELIFDICLEVVLAILWGGSYGFNVGLPTKGDILGPQGFPRIVIALCFILIAYQIFVLVKKMIKERNEVKEASGNKTGFIRLAVCVLLLVLYIFGMSTFGYALTTALFVFAFGKAIGYKHNIKLLIYTAVITVVLVLLFGSVFSITLPRGKWFLRELSFYWY